MTFAIPVRVKNPLNGSQGRSRGGMIARARERKNARKAALLCALAAGLASMRMPIVNTYGAPIATRPVKSITLTRVAPRPLDSHDGLQAACKPLVDGIADALGIKDNDPRVTWLYSQRRGKVREYAVEVRIE